MKLFIFKDTNHVYTSGDFGGDGPTFEMTINSIKDINDEYTVPEQFYEINLDVPDMQMEELPLNYGYRTAFVYDRTTETITAEYYTNDEILKRDITILKGILYGEDYKIIKSYESSLLGVPATDYDYEVLCAKRSETRDKINELQNLLTKTNEA